MALAVVLLVGAGLMLRSSGSLQRVDLGFNPAGVLTMRISLPATSYADAGTGRRLSIRGCSSASAQLPGVAAAGAARSLPLGSTIGDFGLRVDGYVPPPGTGAKGDWQIVTDGYIEAIGERSSAAAAFAPADTTDSQLVALDQRGDGAPLLGRPRSDRRTLADRRRRPNGPG